MNDPTELLRRCAGALRIFEHEGCLWCYGGGHEPHDAGCELAALITELQALGFWPQQPVAGGQTSFLDLTEESS
jgi:hypothetical protein